MAALECGCSHLSIERWRYAISDEYLSVLIQKVESVMTDRGKRKESRRALPFIGIDRIREDRRGQFGLKKSFVICRKCQREEFTYTKNRRNHQDSCKPEAEKDSQE